jgi:uncharacterized membrane protein
MTSKVIITLLLFTQFMLLTDCAYAYIGPGAGLGMIGSLIAIIVAVVIIFLGLIIYPIRRLLKRKSRSEKN